MYFYMYYMYMYMYLYMCLYVFIEKEGLSKESIYKSSLASHKFNFM